MSIHFSGTLKRSAGVMSAITKQMKNVNLKAVKRIAVSFDPFDEASKATREFLFLLSTPKVVRSNPNCVLKTDVVCDRSKPQIKFTLTETAKEQASLKEVLIVSDKLNTLELLQLCNKHISKLAPPENVTAKLATKSEKQRALKRK